jgi:DNA-binding LacI/PurR family transcriptional regulator
VMNAATDAGRHVPRDFSVVSVDMPAQAALMTTPTMTTVGPTAAAMGRAAAAMLIERVEGGPAGVTQMLFDGELVLRESTGPVPVRTPPDHDTA